MPSCLSKIAQTHQKQQTLKRVVKLSGAGVHTGQVCTVHISPAPDDYGFCFERQGVLIPALSEYVSSAKGAMTLTRAGVSVQTVEHLLAALIGLGFHNAHIQVSGPEIPILDGSALPWMKELLRAGVQTGSSFAEAFILKAPMKFQCKNSFAYLQPAKETSIACHIRVGARSQFAKAKISPDIFRTQIAPARTYVQKQALESMKQKGLLGGAQLDSGVLLDGDQPINTKFRLSNECARHKILDAMGDFALLGIAIIARIDLWNNNHDFHRRLIHRLLNPPECNSRFESSYC